MRPSGLARALASWPAFRVDLVIAAVALGARAAALVWAGGRFPPAADGVYFHTLASRVAAGLGSTWLWPDGKVTYAAHYPVGYPAILALVYRFTGPSVVAAGVTNAIIGTAAAVAVYRVALEATRSRWALLAGLAVALHPALVMYTPAVMTEGVTASLLALGAWAASRGSRRSSIVLGLVIGAATLVRPQSLVLAPCFGLLAVPYGAPFAARLRRAALATVLAVAVCAPWTLRNCVRMNRCALVSFNGGWNLLIGAHEGATGTFAPLEVPESCRTVWDEAEKDACFASEARGHITREPGRWLGLVPAKLAATFDYSGAPGFYLHQSNADAFGAEAKRLLGIVETAFERIAYLSALVVAALASGPMRRTRQVVAAVSAALLFQTHAYVAVLGLMVTLALRGKDLFTGPALGGTTFFTLLTAAMTHAVFFGSGRYSMVVFPLVTAFALCYRRPAGAPDSERSGRLILTAPGAGRDTEKKTEETAKCP